MELVGAQLVIGLVITFFAGVTQGLAGFGFSLVFVSAMLLLLEPRLVVPIVTVHSALINVIIFIGVRKWLEPRRILPLIIAGIAGIPFGTRLLLVLDSAVLKVFTGVFIVMFAVAFLAGFERKIRNEGVASIGVGFLSGLLNGSTGFSGPPVILFFTNQGAPKNVFRANLVSYFMVLNFTTLGWFFSRGLMSRPALNISLMLLPAMVVGAVGGIALAGRVEEKLFRWIALVIVLVAGILAVVSGARTLL